MKLYSCTHMATAGVKVLVHVNLSFTLYTLYAADCYLDIASVRRRHFQPVFHAHEVPATSATSVTVIINSTRVYHTYHNN